MVGGGKDGEEMSEITRITTIQITEIFKNQTDLQEKTEYGKEFAEDVKNIFGADDVVATNVQDFVME